MTFVTPMLAIAGIAAIAIPILIHLLFRQRKKPIEWAAMRFLLEAFRKHKKRLRIEQIILLAVRCLILALLGFALARPLLQSAGLLDLGGSRTIFIVLDNGMTSQLEDADGEAALARHIEQANAVIDALKPGDKVSVITASRPVQHLLNPPTGNHVGVKKLLAQMQPSYSPTDLPAALGTLRSALDLAAEDADQTLVYLLSDFRRGSAPLDGALSALFEDFDERVTFFTTPPATDPTGNIQITSIDPLRSLVLRQATDGSGQATVRLARRGGQLGAEISQVTLAGDDVDYIPPQTVEWKPGQTQADVDFNLTFSTTRDGDVGVTASIDNDALGADNARYAVLSVRNNIRAVLIERKDFGAQRELTDLTAGQWIRRALEPYADSPIEIVETAPGSLSPIDLRLADVAVLTRPDLLDANGWDTLREFVDGAGLLIITPPGEARVHQWADELEAKLDLPWRISKEVVEHADGLRLADEQPGDALLQMISGELEDLSRPIVAYRTLPLLEASKQVQAILNFTDGSPLLAIGAPSSVDIEDEQSETWTVDAQSRGRVAYLAVSPDLLWTNLPSKPLMVPLFQELVRQGLSQIRSMQQLAVGAQDQLVLPAAADKLVGAEEQSIDVQDQNAASPLNTPGLYKVADRAAQPIGVLAVNVDSAAGRTGVQSESAVMNWLGVSGPWRTFAPEEVGAAIESADAGSPLARTLLYTVFALVLLEIILARWFSHAYQPGDRKRGILSFRRHARAAKTVSAGGAA